MKVKQVIVTALVLWLFVVCAAATRAQPPHPFPLARLDGRQTAVQTLVHGQCRSYCHLVGHPGLCG